MREDFQLEAESSIAHQGLSLKGRTAVQMRDKALHIRNSRAVDSSVAYKDAQGRKTLLVQDLPEGILECWEQKRPREAAH